VIGSAVNVFHWMKEATGFLRRNWDLLVTRPVWLFSSGPLGTDETDAQGRDVREVAAAKETGELVETVKARDHRMFFGAFQPDKPIGLTERWSCSCRQLATAFPKGDFCDWGEIDRWAEGVARSLSGRLKDSQ
jgi:menaquinone-dependent protoporphyrinogen oxidase